MIDKKNSIKKKIQGKITIKRIRTKIDIKIKLYQILRNELKIIIIIKILKQNIQYSKDG
jgi:hypothetical protein